MWVSRDIVIHLPSNSEEEETGTNYTSLLLHITLTDVSSKVLCRKNTFLTKRLAHLLTWISTSTFTLINYVVDHQTDTVLIIFNCLRSLSVVAERHATTPYMHKLFGGI